MPIRLKEQILVHLSPPPGGFLLFLFLLLLLFFVLFLGFGVFFVCFLVFFVMFDVIFVFLSSFSVDCIHFRRKILILDDFWAVLFVLEILCFLNVGVHQYFFLQPTLAMSPPT